MVSLEKIERIKVNKQTYDVTFLEMGMKLDKYPNITPWICAYVLLPGASKMEDLANATYGRNDVIGIDTNHYHNFEMNLEERKQDARTQIIEVIKEYRKKRGKRK